MSSILELLFLHGRYETNEHWRALTDQLDYSVKHSFVDLPVFEQRFTLDEQVDIATRYILNENRELVLVGHDLGGVIVQLAALQTERQNSRLLKGLILFNSSSLSHFSCPRLKYFVSRQLKRLLRSSGRKPTELRDKMRVPEIAHLQSISSSWPNEEKRIELHRQMRHFNKPVLVLWGNLDEMNPAREVNEIMANYPNVELFQEDGVGHWPWIEHPEWVSTKVQEFLFKLRGLERKIEEA